ncbi:MAG: Transcriptional regulatory protein UhpA [Bryobacteraceae bacterium]|nr:Transcriptional regulatory protein UhpA [Bryobacteraceae bacterium]
MAAITLFACESQPIVIEGLRRILEQDPDIELLGTVSTLSDALPQISRLRPQIVLLDQSAGLKLVFRFLGDLKAASPGVLSVLWSAELAEVESFRALQLGARGILRKTLPVPAILDCLRAVAKGNIWIEHNVSNHAAGFLSRGQTPRLTPREREIVRCLCRGLRNKEIAGELSITPGTVKVHLMHIFEKTGVKDRFELAVRGPGLLGLDVEVEERSSTSPVLAARDTLPRGEY